MVWDVKNVSVGEIMEQSAYARFTVHFECLMQRPEEVMRLPLYDITCRARGWPVSSSSY